MHAFQGRTVDNVIAAMEANHPEPHQQKTLYVEISRAPDRAELVTDDAQDAAREARNRHRGAGLGARGDRRGLAASAGERPGSRCESGPGGGSRGRTGARETGRAGSRFMIVDSRQRQAGACRRAKPDDHWANVPDTVRFQAESAPRSPLGLMPCLSKFDFSRSFTFLVHPHAPCRAPRRSHRGMSVEYLDQSQDNASSWRMESRQNILTASVNSHLWLFMDKYAW